MSTVISICEPLWTDPIPSLKTGNKHRKYCVFKTDVTLGHTLRETDGLFRVFKVYPVWTVACPIKSVACQSTSTQVQCIIFVFSPVIYNRQLYPRKVTVNNVQYLFPVAPLSGQPLLQDSGEHHLKQDICDMLLTEQKDMQPTWILILCMKL